MTITLAIDFETANYPRDSAIALGLSVIENNTVRETRSWMFKPAPDPRFDPERIYIRRDFIAIHGITSRMLKDKHYFDGYWHEMQPYFEEADQLIAHNAGFDRTVLDAVLARYELAPLRRNWQCTVNISRTCWPGLVNHKLSTVAEHLGIALNHHEAASDAEACARIFIASQEAKTAAA
jgi:DNA polymerase-3 subunit epsilon